MPAPVLLVLLACGSDELTRLETRQRSLEREVAVLRQTVGDLRGALQAEGAVRAGPNGPRSPAAGAVAPHQLLVDELPFTIQREGSAPALEAPAAERRADTLCGWRLPLPQLEPLSDFALGRDGLGRASPLRLTVAGVALTPHSQPAAYDRTCEGAFRHQGQFLFFSPPEPAEQAPTPTLGLAEAVPLSDEEGRLRYWVYPGTALVVSFAGTWDEGQWGAPHVVYDLRLRAVGPMGPSHQPTLTLPDGRVMRGESTTWRGSEAFVPPPRPHQITIASPQGGPYVLVESLALGNDSHAAVVTSKRHPPEGAP